MRQVRLGRSVRFALRGARLAWFEQPNFRIEVCVGAAALLLCLWSGAPLAPVVGMAGLVLGLELANSALETVVDLVRPDHHELAAAAKDLGAAAVLVAAVAALCVGLLVIGPPLARKLLLIGGA